MSKVKLKDIAQFINGDRGKNYPSQKEILKQGEYLFINAGHLGDNGICFDDMNYITQEKYDLLSSGKIQENDILYCLRGSLGKKAVISKGMRGAVASSLVIIRLDSSKAYYKYLMYALDSPSIIEQQNRANNGSSQPNLSAASVKEYQIMLPPLETQKQIAANLDKVTRMIDLCNALLEKLDLLVKARFVEMFGDKEYPYQELISLIVEGAGLSYGIVQPGDDGTGDMGVLRPVDMVDGSIAIDSIKYIDRQIGVGYQKTELTGQELLITVRGTTGITALTDERFSGMNVTRGIAVIRYNSDVINPVYLNEFLKSDESQRYIQENTRGATLKQINLSDLRVQKILVPPIELQEQFAAFVAQTDKSKAAVKALLQKAETLKKALMQEYFG